MEPIGAERLFCKPPAFSSVSWLPFSMILPSRMTRITSAFSMVLSRCATTKLVRPCIITANAFWIFSSVRVSMDEVASSRISIGGRLSIARAMQINCF